MKQTILTVAENRQLAENTFRMRLCGDVSAMAAPGQFIDLRLPGLYLRRPISVSDWDDGSLTILYKVVGRGTAQLRGMDPGDTADVLVGLGNGFDAAPAGDAPLLVGGGIGAAPLYRLARELRAQGRRVAVALGFNTAGDCFYEDEFRALGCTVAVATADGSRGVRGFVTDVLPERCSYFFACGPGPMLRAVSRRIAAPGQLSLEERMGCGFGACMGCTCKTAAGHKRICKDGPVLRKEEIVWDD